MDSKTDIFILTFYLGQHCPFFNSAVIGFVSAIFLSYSALMCGGK